MDIKEFTIMLDEYVVVDPVDGFCYFWSKSEFEANLFLKVKEQMICKQIRQDEQTHHPAPF